MSETTVITNIEAARLLTLRAALSIEVKTGLQRSSRGRSTGTLIREATGLKARTKEVLLRDYEKWLEEQGIRIRKSEQKDS